MDGIQDFGQRIVQAARLAVAVHLYESVAGQTDRDGPGCRAARQILRQIERQVTATGGAGLPDAAAADPPTASTGGVGGGLRALLTDDERDGLVGADDEDDGEDHDAR
jgi:hypothetical protein